MPALPFGDSTLLRARKALEQKSPCGTPGAWRSKKYRAGPGVLLPPLRSLTLPHLRPGPPGGGGWRTRSPERDRAHSGVSPSGVRQGPRATRKQAPKGGGGAATAVNSPGCITEAVTVGATTKTDSLSSFSNSASMVDLLAPGSSINSSVPGGGFAPFNGTSMATPHVAGAITALRSVCTNSTVD